MKDFVKRLLARPWIKHLIAAWKRMSATNGNLYAGAITYFSFLAIFPMLLLGVSIAGFVLHAHPAALQSLFDHITSSVPGEFGRTLQRAIHTAIDQRTTVGVVGLAGVLLTGLGWIGNLRAAIDAIWKRTPPKENFIRAKVTNLVILVGLGLGVLVSLGLTALWSAFSHRILSALGLDHITGMGTVFAVIGILVTLAGDSVIFFYVLVRLPQAKVPLRAGIKGALLASVGFEILKIAGTYTIASSAHSPTAGPFAGIIAVLVWLQLVIRMVLFAAAWTAELAEITMVSPPRRPSAVGAVLRRDPEVSPTAVGAGLVGAGMAAGAAVTAYRIRRAHNDKPK